MKQKIKWQQNYHQLKKSFKTLLRSLFYLYGKIVFYINNAK